MKSNSLRAIPYLCAFLSIVPGFAADSPAPAGRPAPQRAPVVSPEVDEARRVTFRLRAPAAGQVSVSGDFGPRLAMARDASGLWTAVTPPLPPNLYGYIFDVDGVRVADPRNFRTRRLRPSVESVVEVGGDEPQLFQVQPVPHGVVHRHAYLSPVLGEPRVVQVYTPPGYEDAPAAHYPVLYLLHGAGEDAAGWLDNAPAAVIVDNLIAQGRAEPMIIVMPLGTVGGNFVTAGPAERSRRIALFARELTEVIEPLVERAYRVQAGRERRAIAGLSMGGAQALWIGLNRAERFAWVGSFGGAIPASNPAAAYPGFFSDPAKANATTRLLWLGCGREDGLLAANRALRGELAAAGIRHTFHESEGAHTWVNWRAYFIEFVPRLFRPEGD
jgi:enterochelin esterase-like enzyme